jgi:polysaccharide export outer membrane protein
MHNFLSRALVGSAALVVGFSLLAPAQDAPGATPSAADAQRVPPVAQGAGEYLIGPNDILKVTVYGHDDLTQTVVVQADGTFTFPLVGRVVCSDMSPEQLSRKLEILLARGFVRSPQVSVVVQEYRSKTVFVVGEVSKPGVYALEGSTTLVQILSKAAPTTDAGSEIMVVRPRDPSTTIKPADIIDKEGTIDEAAVEDVAQVIKVDWRAIQMGRLDLNIVLQPNDTIFVTQAGKIYVLGEVRNPGAYVFSPNLTVRQAISMAGGFTEDASTGKVRIIRDTERRPKDEIKVKLDVPVQPGDTIVVKARWF